MSTDNQEAFIEQLLGRIIAQDIHTTCSSNIIEQADDIDEAFFALGNVSPRVLHLREVLWDSDGENPELEDELEGYESHEPLNYWVIAHDLFNVLRHLEAPVFWTKQDLCIFVNHWSSLHENPWLRTAAVHKAAVYFNAIEGV